MIFIDIGCYIDKSTDETTFKASFTWSQNKEEIDILRSKLTQIDKEVNQLILYLTI